MITRRDFGLMAAAALALPRLTRAGAIDSVIGGVRVGAQSYSFRGLTRPPGSDLTDALVKAYTDVGLGDCELWSPQIEPVADAAGRGNTPEAAQARARSRDALRAFRTATPLDHFVAIRKKFDAAGITISAFNYSFGADFTDQEIDRGFVIAKALGARIITASTTLEVAGRVVPFAEQHQMDVAMHNHSNTTDPNEFATPESFAAAQKLSRRFKVNLDIGHFTAANFDAVAWLREHHASVTNLHIKDRRRNQGDNVPWGTGDTPIREVLQLVKREKWPLTAHLEYEHRGTGTPVDEVRKCLDFAKQALA
jgi:sugar phosphate isomerase/epimerase